MIFGKAFLFESFLDFRKKRLKKKGKPVADEPVVKVKKREAAGFENCKHPEYLEIKLKASR